MILSCTYLRTSEAAKYLGISCSLLEKLRLVGGGPAYAKLSGKLVRYAVVDLDTWVAGRKRRSTSE